MSKAELGLYRGLTNVLILITWLFLMPLALLIGLFVGNCFQWLADAHWPRATLCTVANYLMAPNIPKVNQFVAHEFDRCEVSTGAKELDLIVNYCLNELSVFISVSAVSFFGIAVFFWLSESVGDHADSIERNLERQRERREDKRAVL